MPLNDATVKTNYIGDSVYVSEIYNDPTTISVFLNNGERQTPDFILRKNEIILKSDVARALVRYIKERIEV